MFALDAMLFCSLLWGDSLSLGQSLRPELGTFRARLWRLHPDEGHFLHLICNCLQFVYNLERGANSERDQIGILFFDWRLFF
jgi:hypothetical protein